MKGIKLIAVDMDGTFLRTGHLYDRERFQRLYQEMKKQEIEFVIASGNQYYQLKSFFPEIEDELSFVAENGGFVLKKNTPIFVGEMEPNLIENVTKTLQSLEEINFLVCGEKAVYAFSDVDSKFYEVSGEYYHRQKIIENLLDIEDKVFKFAIHCPKEKTDEYLAYLTEEFSGEIAAVSSGHGDIDLIIPGVHKASGLERLGKEFQINQDEMMAFGDGGNDIEMLQYVGYGVLMKNASEKMRGLTSYQAPHHNDDGVLIVIETYLTEGIEGLRKFEIEV